MKLIGIKSKCIIAAFESIKIEVNVLYEYFIFG